MKTISFLCRTAPALFFTTAMLVASSCGTKSTEGPDMAFDKAKWSTVEQGQFPYRRRMLNAVQNGMRWTGVSKDSVIRVLGLPSQQVEGDLWYKYDQELTILGYSDNVLVFELGPDSTVTSTKVRNSGFD